MGEMDADTNAAGGWLLRAYFYNSSGSYITSPLADYSNTVSSNWTQNSGQVTAPANTATIRVEIMAYSLSG